MNIENQSKINIDNLFLSCINYAIESLASDIHIEPYVNFYKLRIRQNGILIEKEKFQKSKMVNIFSQLKILAKLDITESRFPQDGKIDYHYKKNHFNLRVSTCPTILGEKIVIRILQNTKKLFKINELGINKTEIIILKKMLMKDSGLIIFSGATGSGKTTSLYACINELDFNKYNIISIEDPVEITFEEINQINIESKLNLKYAEILKATLRQDPDIIIIGEIRDQETAKISIAAAQTGHLVLTTIHCNSAIQALDRFKEFGISQELLKNTINLIVHQKFTDNKTNRKPVFEMKQLCM